MHSFPTRLPPAPGTVSARREESTRIGNRDGGKKPTLDLRNNHNRLTTASRPNPEADLDGRPSASLRPPPGAEIVARSRPHPPEPQSNHPRCSTLLGRISFSERFARANGSGLLAFLRGSRWRLALLGGRLLFFIAGGLFLPREPFGQPFDSLHRDGLSEGLRIPKRSPLPAGPVHGHGPHSLCCGGGLPRPIGKQPLAENDRRRQKKPKRGEKDWHAAE